MSRQEDVGLWHWCVLALTLCLTAGEAGLGGPPPLPRHRAKAMVCRPGVDQVIRYLDELNKKIDEDVEEDAKFAIALTPARKKEVPHQVTDAEIEYVDEFEEVFQGELEYFERATQRGTQKTPRSPHGSSLVEGRVFPPGNPRDPIYTGPNRIISGRKKGRLAPANIPGYGFKFSEEVAPKLKSVSLGSVPLKLKKEIRLNLVLKHKSLPAGLTIPKNVTLIQDGNGFTVYFVHPQIPNELEGVFHEKRLRWAKEHATHVIKLMKPDLDGSPFDWVPFLEFDLSVKPLLDHLASRATYQGKPLVEFLPTVTELTDHSRGGLIQRAVHGPTAYELQEAINLLSNSERAQGVDAEQVGRAFQRIASFSGGNVDEAQRKIHALEQFMRDATPIVKRQRERFDLKRPYFLANEAPPGSPFDGISVEIDYNRGHNVIWDEKRQIFDVRLLMGTLEVLEENRWHSRE